ncbi:hypothetical protein AD940_00875 [Gluconobacter thailandicus]|nr:hypothetical protein AD940_00875 [Gluconobacter thailandicus]
MLHLDVRLIGQSVSRGLIHSLSNVPFLELNKLFTISGARRKPPVGFIFEICQAVLQGKCPIWFMGYQA